MKTRNLFLLPALIASVGLILAGRVTAQTFTTLHSFTGGDGAGPEVRLILSGNTLYGTTRGGTVFAINTDGTGFTTLYRFTAGASGGIEPNDLILSGNTLYGTAKNGGSSDNGTVFFVNTDGTDFTTLHSFTGGRDGSRPFAGLIISGNTLFGTAIQGGSSGFGTVFKINTNGTGFTTLHTFTAGDDGSSPIAGLTLSGNTLYGTASSGGSSGSGRGTVFSVNTDGTGFTILHSFTEAPLDTNSDGALPYAGLVLSGNTLYGTARNGGSSDQGTVFAVNTDGTDFTTLHSFTATSGSNPFGNGTNSDGAQPFAALIFSGNTLYGTATGGGSSGSGTVFGVNTDGKGFTTLHSFTAPSSSSPYTNSDGGGPSGELILSGNTLYGTASYGGSSGSGVVFSLSFRPQLSITPSGAYVIFTWPTNVAGFEYTGYTLQSTTNLVAPATWTSVFPGPVVIDGQNAVTNLISGRKQFYRLSQ